MDYFVWYDENSHKTPAQKIQEAITAYVVRFTEEPPLILINMNDQTEMDNIVVRCEPTVQRNTFWLAIRKPVR